MKDWPTDVRFDLPLLMLIYPLLSKPNSAHEGLAVCVSIAVSHSHAVEELSVCFVSFPLWHEAVQLVDKFCLHLLQIMKIWQIWYCMRYSQVAACLIIDQKGALCDLFEVAALALLPVHHVVKDWDHHVPQVRLRHQCHLQERPDHRRDEVQLVLSCTTRWKRSSLM